MPLASLAPVSPERLTQRWPAAWCRYPDGPHQQSAVYFFRRSFILEQIPDRFIVHITADQRYQLFINGQRVCRGPARGDLLHWRFESLDIAPFLTAGENVIAALVHYMDTTVAPLAQITSEAAFLMQGNSDAEALVNTPGSPETGFWSVVRSDAWSFSLDSMKRLRTYFSVGPDEFCRLASIPTGWQNPGFTPEANWVTPERVNRSYSAPYGLEDGESTWWLVPRPIPLMEEIEEPFGRLVRVEGVANAALPLTIPPQTKVVLLFDHGFETCAYPEIQVAGGANTTVTLSYAESLLPADAQPWELNRKGNRNETENRILHGYSDTWILDGNEQTLSTLWWKTFRYLQVTVETGDEPLTLTELRSLTTGYPFEEKATFAATELPDADKIWEVGWRTIRRCTHETYVDCPYYEQLQYVGDTRIQALVTQYVSGDHRLFKNALSQLFESRLPDGLTHSRYPCRVPQIITGFSLWWVCMLHDYLMHVPGEDDFLRSLLPGCRSVLHWFRDRIDPVTELMGPLDWWCFGDWASSWRFGTPPGAKEGGSAFMTLQYALACTAFSELLEFCNGKERLHKSLRGESSFWSNEAENAAKMVREQCFDKKTRRVADTPTMNAFSQHAAILGILADAVPEKHQEAVMERVLADTELTQATFYFRFYLNRALVKAGMGDRYVETLTPWRNMLQMGLTTWSENPEPTRSDCHAWSASPNYEFLATILGILPGSPGFSTVELRPHLGPLTQASGRIPHPSGEVSVSYRRDSDTLYATVTLPEDIRGTLHWQGKRYPLKPGLQTLSTHN